MTAASTVAADFVPTPVDWSQPVIDTDVHINIGSVERLYPYMEKGWVDWIESSAFREPLTIAMVFPKNSPATVAPRYRRDGRLAAGDLATLQQDVLDVRNVERAIVHPYWGLEGVRHPELAAILATAINDWLIDEFLSKDDRLRGTVTVPHHDPNGAIKEIERIGGHPGMVQVGLPVWSQMLWGKRLWHPMFKAIAAQDLVAAIHYGGQAESVPTSTGWPAYFIELYSAAPQMFMSQLVNMVGEGLFDAVPELRVTFLESGFTWIPGMLWRMNKEWKGLRRDIPWVKRPPAEIVRDHVRVSIQPTDGAPAHELSRFAEWLGSEDMLMYASDYPHAHTEGRDDLLKAVSPEVQRKIMSDNARRQYRL